MKREERQLLAKVFSDRMAAELRGGLVLGGLYGSTARQIDTEWSDLELFFVVQSREEEAAKHFLFRNIVVGYRAVAKNNLETILATPSRRWPFHMGVLSALQVLLGDPRHVQEWLRLGQSVPRERFIAALEELLPDLVTEAYGRIHSSHERGDNRTLWPSVLELLMETRLVLCLPNGRWVTHDYYQGLADAFAFPKVPKDYPMLATALWDARDPAETLPLVEQLYKNLSRLLEEEGVKLPNYQRVEEVPL